MSKNIIREMKLITIDDATDTIELRRATYTAEIVYEVWADGELVAAYPTREAADKRFVRECRDYFHEMM